MSEIDDLFNALMFGSGSWLGLLLIIAIMLLIVTLVKYSSVVLLPFQALMINFYLSNIETNSNFMWSIILMFFVMILTIVIEVKRGK